MSGSFSAFTLPAMEDGITVLQRYPVLFPGTCECVTLCSKRDSAHVIKDLGMRRLYWIIGVNPKCYHKHSYKREGGED